jgi:diguanylate cyclase
MGLGIAGMHYTGMAAMEMHPGIQYDPALVVASIVIGIVGSAAALWINQRLSHATQRWLIAKRASAAAVMGIAIAAMHYTGMAAASFPSGSVSDAATGISAQWVAVAISVFSFAALAGTLMMSHFDARTTFLSGSVANLNDQLVRFAALDTLTGLPNRRTLTMQIERAIPAARRSGNLFAILFMDLDGFKTINDTLGHPVGDEVLKTFAQRLQECVRGSDTVARLGGDEFVVLAEGLNSTEDARLMAEGVLKRMNKELWCAEQPLHVTPSIGITMFPQDGETVDTLLKNADAAMYEAKRAGRDQFRFFEPCMNEAAMRTLQIHHALHEALDSGYFSMHFEAKFRCDTGDLAGADTLIRLNHPELGMLAPTEFIPLAERSSQIVQIGYWAVRETCRQIRRWERDGLPLMKVTIKLSHRQLVQPDMVARMLAITTEEGVSCEQLMFEISQTVAMQDVLKTIEMVRAFRESGFDIAIAELGSGSSSLAYLHRFRVKQLKLKIDPYLSKGMDDDSREGEAIVAAIIGFAHSQGMSIVAEGVETAAQVSKLKALLCDEMQGLLLGKPLTADAFGALLRERMAA